MNVAQDHGARSFDVLTMRLQPVYLLAPEPEKTRAQFSRRALLASAVAAFGVGWGLGSAMRGVVGRPEVPGPEPLPPEDEALVAWAEGLQSRPVAQLVSDRGAFFQVYFRFPSSRQRLRSGLTKLAAAEISGAADLSEQDRGLIARELLQLPDLVAMSSGAEPILSLDQVRELRLLTR